LGSDLIEIARVEKAAREERFLARTFTEEERRQSGGNMAFLAGCFAVKEAVVKCFGTGFRGIEPAEIEVLRDALGKPYVRLSGAAAAYCAALGGLTPLVSISDTKTHAMAVAVLEREDRGGIK
jgi:holo-[acyl-carrier-protein] synthase